MSSMIRIQVLSQGSDPDQVNRGSKFEGVEVWGQLD